MDAFNMPSLDAPVNYGANLGGTLSAVAPLATGYHGAQSTQGSAQQVFNQPASTAKPSVMSQFGSKLEAIGKESAHLTEGAGSWLLHQGEQMAEGVIHFPVSAARFSFDAYNTYANNAQQSSLETQRQNITSQWKSGQITNDQFKTSMQQWNKDSQSLSKQISDNTSRIGVDGGSLTNDTINTASAILTVMTGGIGGGAKAAGTAVTADYLKSTAADTLLNQAEKSIGKLAVDKAAFSTTSGAVQNAVKNVVLKTVLNASPNMTSKQITRTAATHLLLTYPLTFNALSATGKQTYTELQNHKYGDATKTLAFNAALLLSGGPIGHALSLGGKGLVAAKAAVFGEQSFLDSLSRMIGDGNASGIYNIIKNDAELTKNFAALEATNAAAENGNVTKAAQRIISGLVNAGWKDTTTLSHQDFVNQINNWATAQRTLTEHLVGKGMTAAEAGRYVVGRWTIGDANYISAQLTKVTPGFDPSAEELLQNWDNLKAANPNASWANNENLNKQVTTILNSERSLAAKGDAIRTIEAQNGGVPGVSKAVTAKLAKLGYVGIEPVNLEAPFKEGGAIKTQFAEGGRPTTPAEENFFLKTTQPVPVLSSVGTMLTAFGLSPEASTTRVYEVFNQNLADNLEKAGFRTDMGLAGATKEENADFINKSLSDYIHNMKPGIKSPPVTDLRQLTLKDIQKALGTNAQEASTVRSAIMDSMLQVPLSVRGLGDRVVDLNYKINPLAGPYARIQGALRYAWNPFFQMRLSYKAEFLAQIEAGGKFPTIAGTNKMLQIVMPEKYAQLDTIGRMLEQNGIFGPGYAAEGADEAAAGYKSLGHALLPSQRRSISGLVSVMSDRVGMTPEQFVTAFPQETKDTVRMILQYDPRSSFLNSPLMRTINLAFFPARFNLKVSTIVARNLGKQSLGVQFSVIKGMMSAHQFLNSQEGQAWYSKNADVIGLFKYFSPLETLSSIAQALGAKPGNVSAYGELGGLPFGWIPQLLHAEGLGDPGGAYVNPTTGAIAQNYVPISMRGRAQAAIEDFIGSVFTYPGSTVGLPSKTSLDVKIAQGLIPGGSTSKDFQKVTPQLTPQQQQFQQVVQNVHGITPTPQNTPQQSGEQGLVPGVTVPAQPTPITNPATYAKPARAKSTKLKKGQFRPGLLPGQTQLGQLP